MLDNQRLQSSVITRQSHMTVKNKEHFRKNGRCDNEDKK